MQGPEDAMLPGLYGAGIPSHPGDVGALQE